MATLKALRTSITPFIALTASALAGCTLPAGTNLPALPKLTPGSCHQHAGLPDRHCTPGAVDSVVTQANIAETICRRGYTRAVRPPLSYTSALKRRQVAAYDHYAGTSPRGYEEDHLIPLELGGAPSDARNLWPQARHAGTTLGSAAKDDLENYLKGRVCVGGLELRKAQQAIASDWVAAYRHYHPRHTTFGA